MSEKGEESAVGPKSQVKSPGKSITPSPIKKRLSMRLLSGREGGLSPPAGFWSTSVPPELMNMAGDGIPHGKLDCLSQDLTSVSKGGLIHKAGGHALVGGIITSCLSADDLKVTATSVSGDMPDQLPIPVKINTEIKEQLKMEIRQLGGKYERISKLLEGVQGPPEVQKKFVVYAMKEAARFKRQDLVSRLGNLLEKIEYEEFLNKDEDSQVF
uniref:INTS6/SAGE1/DDX26B/CT45 C-terminal domain-containing protein n=1 Tax=Ursus americanus TaxID=9643 RepID=A0A452QEJ4_URSAM